MKKIRVLGLVLAVMAMAAFMASCSNPAGPSGNNRDNGTQTQTPGDEIRGDVYIGFKVDNDGNQIYATTPWGFPVITVICAPPGITASVKHNWGYTAPPIQFQMRMPAPIPAPYWTITLSPTDPSDIITDLFDDINSGQLAGYVVSNRFFDGNNYIVHVTPLAVL